MNDRVNSEQQAHDEPKVEPKRGKRWAFFKWVIRLVYRIYRVVEFLERLLAWLDQL